jgi:hypothetical protein
LPESWLNDGAKGFVSTQHETTPRGLPQFEALRLTAPTAEYMLAMKCMAARVAIEAGERGDIADIKTLIEFLELEKPEEAMETVARYYPEERIPPRARFLIEDLFAREEREE